MENKVPYIIDHSFLDEKDTRQSKVFIDKFSIDKGTMSQIKTQILHPSVKNVRIMPDCHRGKGCCVGFTSEITDKIVPNYIGGDIGCGIICYNTNIKFDNLLKMTKMEDIDNNIRKLVPMGTKENNIHKISIVNDDDIENICNEALNEAYNFAYHYNIKFGININEKIPNYSVEWFKKRCLIFQIEYDYVLRGIGSLGGGNHYIELNKDKNDIIYITIHTGSRNLGQAVCNYHQNKINETRIIDYKELDDTKNKLTRKIKNSKTLKYIMDNIKEEIYNNRHPDYLHDEETHEYFFDMIFAQKYAELNRKIILKNIIKSLNNNDNNKINVDDNVKINKENLIESIHNYIDFNDFILRKGAIAAHKDKLCIISLNMRDGILLCKGKGNIDWNQSSAHGCGRLLMRHESEHKISLEMFKESMKGIYSSSVVRETIDESPFTYKDSKLIKQLINDSVEIIDQLYPIMNLKSIN